MPSSRSPLLLWQCFFPYCFFPFLSIKFCYCFAICVSVWFSVQMMQELRIFWTSVFLDFSACNSGRDEVRMQTSLPWPASILSVFLCVLRGLELECLGMYIVQPFTDGKAKPREKTYQGCRNRCWQTQAWYIGFLTPKLVLFLSKSIETNKAALGFLPSPCRRSHSQAVLRVPCLFLA
jgi:hypothetical protein